ncbi:hypothetical protein ACO22_02640 [Paracoccidioides brasiliensis]|uniref:Uncharacterized protein n=1 Tax=Paracoccidioides brasiliensis TaxID=121759 RepID=A0A1D2JI59_PARBR|nr:hypothetical protein ACO22_02640 [Paracoccidioides brasiliensis]
MSHWFQAVGYGDRREGRRELARDNQHQPPRTGVSERTDRGEVGGGKERKKM